MQLYRQDEWKRRVAPLDAHGKQRKSGWPWLVRCRMTSCMKRSSGMITRSGAATWWQNGKMFSRWLLLEEVGGIERCGVVVGEKIRQKIFPSPSFKMQGYISESELCHVTSADKTKLSRPNGAKANMKLYLDLDLQNMKLWNVLHALDCKIFYKLFF